MLGELERSGQLLFDDEKRGACAADLPQRPVHVVHHPGGEPEGELVDDEQLRRYREDAGEREHALLASREGARELAAPVGEPREALESARERVGCALAAEGAREGEAEVVLDVQGCEHRTPLGSVSDAQADEPPRRKTGDLLTGEEDPAFCQGHEPGRDTGDRRLSCTVRAYERGDRTRGDRQGHAEQRPETTVCGRDVAKLEHRRLHRGGDRRDGERPVAGGHVTSPRYARRTTGSASTSSTRPDAIILPKSST